MEKEENKELLIELDKLIKEEKLDEFEELKDISEQISNFVEHEKE